METWVRVAESGDGSLFVLGNISVAIAGSTIVLCGVHSRRVDPRRRGAQRLGDRHAVRERRAEVHLESGDRGRSSDVYCVPGRCLASNMRVHSVSYRRSYPRRTSRARRTARRCRSASCLRRTARRECTPGSRILGPVLARRSRSPRRPRRTHFVHIRHSARVPPTNVPIKRKCPFEHTMHHPHFARVPSAYVLVERKRVRERVLLTLHISRTPPTDVLVERTCVANTNLNMYLMSVNARSVPALEAGA
jgi:hypothetical protein